MQQGAPSAWTQAFSGFDDWDDTRKQQMVTHFFEAAGQSLQTPKIVPKPNDDEIQLRGTYQNIPTRVICDAFFDLEIDMKSPNSQHEMLQVRFDPGSAPTAGDVDPWDDDDEMRVFLSKCVFVEASANELETQLRIISQLPPDFMQHLCHLMQTNGLSSVTLTSDGARTGFRANIGEMWDPMVQLGQVLWLLGYGANVYAALQAAPAMAPVGVMPATNVARATCQYCTTVYMLTPASRCPNCGAPYTG